MRSILCEKMIEGLVAASPKLTRRSARLPAVPNKALAVLGIRRGGKTSFLWQCLADRLGTGTWSRTAAHSSIRRRNRCQHARA
jgi:hypothetical protein